MRAYALGLMITCSVLQNLPKRGHAVSGVWFQLHGGSCTRPFRHRASAPLSTGVLPVRGTPGQWCDVLQLLRYGAAPISTTGLVFAHREGKCCNLAAELRVQKVPDTGYEAPSCCQLFIIPSLMAGGCKAVS